MGEFKKVKVEHGSWVGTGEPSTKGTAKRLSDKKMWAELAAHHFNYASRGHPQTVPVYGMTQREYRRLCNRIRKLSIGSNALLVFKIYNLREDFAEIRELRNGGWKLREIVHKDYPHPRRRNQGLEGMVHTMQLWVKVSGGIWKDEPEGGH